jgi:hypothetical protein
VGDALVLREFIPLILLMSPVLGLFLLALSLVVWIGAIYDAYHGAEEFKRQQLYGSRP